MFLDIHNLVYSGSLNNSRSTYKSVYWCNCLIECSNLMSAFMLSSKTVHKYEDYKMGSYGEMLVHVHVCSVLILNHTRQRDY
jgi:hypothetical protein